MTAASHDIVIEKGTDYLLELTWKDSDGNPIDLTGYDARMQIRQTYSSDTTVVDASVTNGKITLGGLNGTISVAFTNNETSLVPVSSGVYDIEIVSPANIVKRLIEGKVTFKQEVTR